MRCVAGFLGPCLAVGGRARAREGVLMIDIMSDARAWCMFASAVLSCEASIGTTAIDAAKAAIVADVLLKEFHSRFRSKVGAGCRCSAHCDCG